MNYSKKGMFIFFTLMIVVFLILAVFIVFFSDRPDVDESLKIGEVVIGVYDANAELKEYNFFLKKSAEYALMKSLEEGLKNGHVDKEILLEEMKTSFNGHLDNYLKDRPEINFSETELNFNGSGFFAKGMAESLVSVSDRRNYNLTGRPNFDIYWKYDFDWYEEMERILVDNFYCLEISRDNAILADIASENLEEELPSKCLLEYPKFKSVEKTEGVLTFNYLAEGHEFEDQIEVPMKVVLSDLEDSLNKDLV